MKKPEKVKFPINEMDDECNRIIDEMDAYIKAEYISKKEHKQEIKKVNIFIRELAKLTGVNECDDWNGSMLYDKIKEYKAEYARKDIADNLLEACKCAFYNIDWQSPKEDEVWKTLKQAISSAERGKG